MISPGSFIAQLGEMGTVGLLISLVVLFVVAFKLLEMVMQTVLVAALSGGFYAALAYYIPGIGFSVNSLLFFTFLGGSLYTGYHLLSQGYSIAKLLISLPVKMVKSLFELSRNTLQRFREMKEDRTGSEEK